MSDWFHPIPVYVTRKNGKGEIGTWTVAASFGALALFLVVINVIVWGAIGLFEAGRVVGAL